MGETSMPQLAAGKYDSIAIAFHWVVAALLIAAVAIGLQLDDMPRGEVKGYWINIHNVLGLLAFIVVIGRIAWRAGHKPPALPASMDAATRWASHIAHWALYALMVAAPLLGLITVWAKGRGVDFGLFQLASPLTQNRDIADAAEGLHKALAWAMIVIAVLHIAAALFHHFWKRDGVLLRMLPGSRGG
jgi:cytochrome b561